MSNILEVVEAINDTAESILGDPIILIKYDGSFVDIIIPEKLLWDSTDERYRKLTCQRKKMAYLKAHLTARIYTFALELIRAVCLAEKC